ncbi:hypothetical protein DSM106972_015980 [Dulcicalothrix desertica PCC 7102]|uniref:Uncharacterized protein n=1 Tax=Dulcicalothrix desertica PCC 7102 TaxID=232991 RepID=A0A433VQP1_9CYAN|nr:hypothetical protein [Dulcicalothrix desertica]RUT08430.1 hypothetical protein DSM106972_015980 [Dulcicalothrix desertica PCC 7102]TWH40295.1 hypothetical protein CAL7102_09602 [Dulcicalothrix desertica PCC 7102]
MAEPTLAQVFGANATQDASFLTISKSDLALVGLTPLADNTAESLKVAILLLAAIELNETKQETNPDIQVVISAGTTPSIISRNDANYRQVTYTVELQTLDTATTIDPDNY